MNALDDGGGGTGDVKPGCIQPLILMLAALITIIAFTWSSR